MSTMFLSCVCDSIVAKLCANGCQGLTEIHEAGTNSADVLIVGIICFAIVLVALIAKWTVLSCKDAELKAAKAEREEQESDESISLRKQKAICLGKLLNFLEARVSKEKDFKHDETQYYIDVLKSLINGQKIPDCPPKN